MTQFGGKVKRECRAFPWSGGKSNPLGTMRRWVLRRWGGVKTPRLLRRKASIFTRTKRFPADTSGADRPYPQTNDRTLSGEKSVYGHPSPNGYILANSLDNPIESCRLLKAPGTGRNKWTKFETTGARKLPRPLGERGGVRGNKIEEMGKEWFQK